MRTTNLAITHLLLSIALSAGLCNRTYGQFKENVRQSYLYYNKARLAVATGKMDSAATYMKESIRLNSQNSWTHFEAWDIFLKAGYYQAVLTDISDFYRKKELPDNISFFFSALDSATYAAAKSNKEIQSFVAKYDQLKMEHRKLYAQSNPLGELLNKCLHIDQFARDYFLDSGDTAQASQRVFTYADKVNIKAVSDYLKSHSLPASADDPDVQGKYFVLFAHWIRDTATLAKYPGWQTIHDSVLKNVYEGKFDVRTYVRILEFQHVAFKNAMSFGLFTSPGPVPDHPNMRKFQGEVDDIAHIDQRRKEWLQPTLDEECLINNYELELPAAYKRY